MLCSVEFIPQILLGTFVMKHIFGVIKTVELVKVFVSWSFCGFKHCCLVYGGVLHFKPFCEEHFGVRKNKALMTKEQSMKFLCNPDNLKMHNLIIFNFFSFTLDKVY